MTPLCGRSIAVKLGKSTAEKAILDLPMGKSGATKRCA
jgi:hypothetical protein